MLSFAAARLRTAARQAARHRDWTGASTAYRAYLDRCPQDSKAWVQYGHVAKEAGDLELAVSAYGRALDAAPDAPETWFHLSHACKRIGDRAAAIDCCTRAALLDPGFSRAAEELIALGARDRIPAQSLPTGSDAVPRPHNPQVQPAPTLDGPVFAPSRYDSFRRQLALAPPPEFAPLALPLTVLIDATSALPVEIRATLSSLLDQHDRRWCAIVQAPPAILRHSVASLAMLEPRIRFAATDAAAPSIDASPHVLLIAAGTMLDRQAIGWFAFTLARTGCVAAYCDHDRSVTDWRHGRSSAAPVFFPMFDPQWTPDPQEEPAAVLIDRARLPDAEGRTGGTWKVLRNAAATGAVVHVPLLLASRQSLPEEAELAPPDRQVADPVPPSSLSSPDKTTTPLPPAARIQIVIQTRDEPAMLRACVDSIRQKATRAELLDITIVDNRSIEPATERLLDGYRRKNIATTLALDEPFNWSRANNLAADIGDAPLLLFLNNDTEMLSTGWDDALRVALSPRDVGIVGATLLYPDGTIQHAGIIMGMGSGGPVHEGIGRAVDTGPNDRWRKPRSAAAVTGAFLAMRRDVFDTVAGFDALNFAIAFNDIDLCMRVRAAGFRVVIGADIRVTHHESKTRGMNVTRSQIAWDLDELGRLYARWGNALFDDPAYNLHWTRTGQPFDGYRMPSLPEVIRRIDLGARADPWAPHVTRDEAVWW